ncbi:chemotaxis protein CheA [Sphingomonas sp. Leaf17]|uniref:chemotaxis protein CheA n=1 Tax=Sphingomonas sp. Leaf17 TaxID=1735683 RepID=UPI0006F3A1AF|nr:chemotaxis protein CheW [Sphingomonas sp. Leaf17]KQM65660.1 chemotaxis protein CheA [Sphingomonas sp. Leaf17]
MDDLLQEFIAETRETLDALSGEVVAWEAAPGDRARLDAIFRFVHTVKGSCGFLDLPRLARLSHAAEDVLSTVRAGNRVPDADLVTAVLAIIDRIGELVEAIDAGNPLDDSGEESLIAALAEHAKPVTPTAAQSGIRHAVRSVRLNVGLLDHMMSGMSDMVLARNELARRLRDSNVDPSIDAALERLSQTVADMRDTVTRTRMQRVETLFSALPRMVRDTASLLGKRVTLTVEGADVELDREMIEVMRDPLGHIIRNSVDHGIEAPALRRLIGKPEAGRLTVAARQSGNQIMIEITDDGAGIDVSRLVAKARALGLRDADTLAGMSEAAKLDLIFEPGLSSRDTVTATSGRGVGMDVVRDSIDQIGGKLTLVNTPGRGLTITIGVPLTLSIISTIVVGVGDQRFALPRQAIEEIVRVRGDTVRISTIGDSVVANVRGRRLAVVDLATLLGIPDSFGRPVDTLAIVSTKDGDFALAVDMVIDTEELVVKPAAPAIMAAGIYAGQTLPDSGLPMLLLDMAGIACAAGLVFTQAIDDADEAEAVADPGISALLFEDLDGERRAIALAVVDRVEKVSSDAIRHTAGRPRLAIGDRIIPLHLIGDIGSRTQTTILRLTDGDSEVAYAIAEPINIVELPADIAAAQGFGCIAGVVMIDGEQIEVVDPHILFAQAGHGGGDRPLCLLRADSGGWMESFLRPTLEGAGYRCATTLDDGQVPDVTLVMTDDDADVAAGDAGMVVRLRRARTGGGGAADGSIYRYDRTGLMAALSQRLADRGAR